MTLLRKAPNDKGNSNFRQISLLAAVPALLVAGPLVGFFIGQWADGKFGTDPYLVIAGVILGFASAGNEIFRLVKKSAAMEKEDEQKRL